MMIDNEDENDCWGLRVTFTLTSLLVIDELGALKGIDVALHCLHEILLGLIYPPC